MSIFDDLYAGLVGRGLSSQQAAGVSAGILAESRGDPTVRNPTSGAFGIGQWLGNRQRGLFAAYGSNPTMSQQLDYLVSELRGGDPGGRYVLAATSSQDTLTQYITRFMRPHSGSETTGDISRGTAVLQSHGQAVANGTVMGTGREYLNSVLGSTIGNFLSDGLAGTGGALAAPGDAIEGAVDSAEQALFGEWFQRIGFALLAILLIGVALFMLAEKPVKDVISNLPPVVPV